jgi:hypothetical protein
MGQSQLHALGRNQRFYVTPELTLGTFIDLGTPGSSTTTGMRVLASAMEYAQERVDRADARGATRSLSERITRRVNCTWSVESYLLPNPTGGTAPDCGPILKAGFGIETYPGATTAYTLSGTQAMPSLCLTRESSGVVSQRLRGAYVNEITISGSGSDEPKLSFSGTGISMVNTGACASANAGSATTGLEVDIGLGQNFEAGSIITMDGGTTHAKIASISLGTAPAVVDSITLDSALTWSIADSITPYAPALGDSGSPINGVSGTLTLDGVSGMPITAFDMTVNNNTKAINDEAFTNLMTDFIPGFRAVTGNITVRARKDQIIELNKRKTFTARDLQIQLGTSPGYATLSLPACEFGFGPLEIPEAEESMFTLSYTALATGAGENEVVLTFL